MRSAEVVTGRVSAVAGGSRVAGVDGVPGDVPILRHVTSIAVGDTAVLLQQGGQSWIIGVLGTAAPPTPAPRPPDVDPPAPPPSRPMSVALRPRLSGSWRGGSWRGDTSDLYQGDYSGRGINTGGCWWSLPSGLLDATLRLVRGQAGAGAAQAPTMCLLAGSGPGGGPSILTTASGPAMARGGSADWSVPASWVAQLESGAAGGIGITSGGSRTPYIALLASGVGMTLSVTYTA